MKQIRIKFAVLALIAGTALAFSTNAKSITITPGWYQVNSSGDRANDIHLTDDPLEAASFCEAPFTQNCVAEYDEDGTRVSAILQGDFSN
ncbi:hypothetical protein [Solitalea canadensis]|uniref:Uncharacterized protein n=1 Tax=Solitalea canadensis (strain ATCC 29591 / DSM 3403 / JCM 21819 / LMG 8368 / NBRC 15130 / NCIMB 12057 / USAM 9D) TaxID=929556 RepID=H8KNT5_SOLCM|nr:hypothetical protein [Solitalea canadensis]AFD05346.1 hypothetical protein Solca_0199 [Solitalea canadensis DSM 3403]